MIFEQRPEGGEEVNHESICSEENSRKKEMANTKDMARSRNNKEVRMLEKSEQGRERGGDEGRDVCEVIEA